MIIKNIHYYILKRAIPIIVGIALFSCIHQGNDTCLTNPSAISFSNDIIPLLNTNCSISGCHSGGNPTGKLNLEAANAYTSLHKPGSGYLDTLNATNSIIYIQMTSSSQPMPPSGQLDICKKDLILKWIKQGAKNN